MISKRDQDWIIRQLRILENTIDDLSETDAKKVFNRSKAEVVHNHISGITHFVAALRP